MMRHKSLSQPLREAHPQQNHFHVLKWTLVAIQEDVLLQSCSRHYSTIMEKCMNKRLCTNASDTERKRRLTEELKTLFVADIQTLKFAK